MTEKPVLVKKIPTDALTYTNCVVVSEQDFDKQRTKHVILRKSNGQQFAFSVKFDAALKSGECGVGVYQRKWAMVSIEEQVFLRPYTVEQKNYIGTITFSVDFRKNANAPKTVQEPLDSDHMAQELSILFGGQVFTLGMILIFKYLDKKTEKEYLLDLTVKSMEGLGDMNAKQDAEPYKVEIGQLFPNSIIIFDKEEGSMINLIGKSKGKSSYRSIISPDWDFQKLGVGGVDKQFSAIFRRAFTSRLYPPEFTEQLGLKHVRGILLYGPPGTGKTLIARQIGKMLNAREPKIVNGPQILDKYVGESEANIRKLFADAEEEGKRAGANSGLHIIIFDEIDAICKQRGSMAGSSSVHDTVVNQLLSKMDGVDQLNNILVIGMTNRRDMIDEALLRPGRLEVQVEIGLPDEHGRVQILRIHTSRMREYDKIDKDVDLDELAKKTKNFSGAEIEGLVRAAQSIAMNRHVKTSEKVALDEEAVDKLKVCMNDFELALENDIKPAFGRSEESVHKFLRRGYVAWCDEVNDILRKGKLLVEATREPESIGFVTCILSGASGSGKSCIAAKIAKESEFPFIRVFSPADMVGFSEMAKCQALHRAFSDAIKSPLSILFLDDIESILDYSPIGPRFSNLVLQALRVLLRDPVPEGHRLLVLATSSEREFLEQVGLLKFFDHQIDVPMLTEPQHLLRVMHTAQVFRPEEIQSAVQRLEKIKSSREIAIGVKRMLALIDFVRRSEGDRAALLISELESMQGIREKYRSTHDFQ